MKTRLLFLPDDRTAIELESWNDAEKVIEDVRAGLWIPPSSYKSRSGPTFWRAIRQGQRVIILPWAGFPSVSLSARHIEVLSGLAEGLTLKELANQLHISQRTLCAYISIIKRRLGTTTLAQTISRAAELGIYPPME